MIHDTIFFTAPSFFATSTTNTYTPVSWHINQGSQQAIPSSFSQSLQEKNFASSFGIQSVNSVN